VRTWCRALFTNPNWDSKDNDRTGRIKELNAHFNRAIELVYNPELEYENEPDWDNPFWQGHLRSIAQDPREVGPHRRGVDARSHRE
jgi:hypothetical protein